MKTTSDFSKADLDNLLRWLSADTEEAGKKYLEIRDGLVRFFMVKGCYEAESIADETINRVAVKLKSLEIADSLQPWALFHGFAKKIFLEYLAGLKNVPVQFDPSVATKPINTSNGEEKERRFLCLEDCMAKLRREESDMMTAYFAEEQREKIHSRRHLAERLNLTMGNLHIKVYRVKRILRECVTNCLETRRM